MNEASMSSSLAAILALAARIERETPHLHVLDVYAAPTPFVEVKDTVHGIVVGFSSEADYSTYCQIVSRSEESRHA